MLTNLLYLILLASGFFAGLFLSRLCADEIKAWRNKLFIISVIALGLIVVISFIPFDIYQYKSPTIITLFFMIIINLTIIWESY